MWEPKKMGTEGGGKRGLRDYLDTCDHEMGEKGQRENRIKKASVLKWM